jgi:hypothetical protein
MHVVTPIAFHHPYGRQARYAREKTKKGHATNTPQSSARDECSPAQMAADKAARPPSCLTTQDNPQRMGDISSVSAIGLNTTTPKKTATSL